MSRAVKNTAFDQPAGVGHNAKDIDKADKETTKRVRELEHKRAVIAGQIKDILNDHKEKYGTPKGSIRKAVKTLDMSEEQYQSKKEIDIHANHIMQLFVEGDGQYTWLRNE